MSASYTPITDLTTLAPTQQAYQLETGEKVIVDIRQQQVAASFFNRTAEAHLAIQVSVWKINDNGGPAVDAYNNKIQPPLKNESVLTSALVEGTVILSDALTQMVIDALERMSNWLVIQAQITAFLAASAAANSISPQ